MHIAPKTLRLAAEVGEIEAIHPDLDGACVRPRRHGVFQPADAAAIWLAECVGDAARADRRSDPCGPRSRFCASWPLVPDDEALRGMRFERPP